MANHYLALSDEIENRIIEDRRRHWVNPYAFSDENAVRKYSNHDRASLLRPTFVRDIEKIIHNSYYNRYSDKTQVFSLYKNDDISRRSNHVQLVARIAKNIGGLLGLNTELIEAISLGHDIGHTPFGHEGERKLSELYMAHAGRMFNHNIQSARVFTTIFPVNLTLQTLDGIVCHNGELELEEYCPKPHLDFDEFEKMVEETYTDREAIGRMIPSTLEGCVMRVSDIIAYVGKDRQDAKKIGLIEDVNSFENAGIGSSNAEIINNMIVSIVEKSYGKPYISMDNKYFEALKKAKSDNYSQIYSTDGMSIVFKEQIFPMIEAVYEKVRADYINGNKNSVIFTHHINYLNEQNKYYANRVNYTDEIVDAIVVDYIASMTDDYLIDLYNYLFPKGKYAVKYKGYFD